MDTLAAARAFTEERIQLLANDGYVLGGKVFVPALQWRAALAVHAGAGISAGHYERFARYFASNGLAVLLYDYRGIGWSSPPDLRGFQAAVEDWSEFDAAAANRFLADRFPGVPLVGVAHSVGAMLLLGAPNSSALDMFVLIAPHTGYFGDYRAAYRVPMAFLWHIFMPVVTSMLGYFPARRLRLGDDIPGGIAMQWARRRSPDLLKGQDSNHRARRLLAEAASLCTTSHVITISDDAFATPKGARRLLSWAPNLSVIHHQVKPVDCGTHRLGHFGFFGAAASKHWWPRMLASFLRFPHSRVPT